MTLEGLLTFQSRLRFVSDNEDDEDMEATQTMCNNGGEARVQECETIELTEEDEKRRAGPCSQKQQDKA